jgi:hypothetical protein
MSALSAETRRLLQLCRHGDDPTPAREQAVRNRLMARLGVTALAGVATASAAVGAAEAASVTSAGVLSGAAPASTAVGSAATAAASVGATTATLVKTVAGLALVVGLGASAWRNDDAVERAMEWSATVAVQAEQSAKRVWHFVTGDADGADATSSGASVAKKGEPLTSSDANRHERLIAIARRPNHPVAKEAELVLILGAEQALKVGDEERAARYLDEHEARFAKGELCQNREALRSRLGSGSSAAPVEEAQPSAASPVAPSNEEKTNF